MKKILSIATVILFYFSSFCQQQKTTYSSADIEVLKEQSKKNKKIGIIMASVGGAMLVGGAIMMIGGFADDVAYDISGGITEDEGNNALGVAGIITSLAGIGVGCGSIPFFKKSHNQRKEADHAQLSMRTNFIPIITGGGIVAKIPQPQLTLSIPLGR